MDYGILNLINVFNTLKSKKSFGPCGKKFEEQIIAELGKNQFIEGSLDPNKTNNLLNLLNMDKKIFNNFKDLIKNLVLDKKNIEPIKNIISNFMPNIYIYINHLDLKIFQIFWFYLLIEYYH